MFTLHIGRLCSGGRGLVFRAFLTGDTETFRLVIDRHGVRFV